MARLMHLLLILAVGLTFLSDVTVRADDTEDEAYDDEDFDDDEDAVSSSDITVKTLIPKHTENKFPLGEDITVLVAFSNNGEKTFNVSQIAAHLHSPFDYNYYIQNFTAKTVGATVGPNSQVTLEYTFKPDKTLEPLEFWFSAYVNYERADGRTFMHTLRNGTIELVDAPGSSGSSYYLVVLAALAAAAYYHTQQQQQAAAAKSKPSEADVTLGGSKSWEDDEIYKPSSSSKRAGGKKNVKKGKKN